MGEILVLKRQDAPADGELLEAGAAGGGVSVSFFGGLMFLGTVRGSGFGRFRVLLEVRVGGFGRKVLGTRVRACRL